MPPTSARLRWLSPRLHRVLGKLYVAGVARRAVGRRTPRQPRGLRRRHFPAFDD
ncbi:MAG TPA: hypothetical protein VGV38_06925 [Pyrinomonadaceae bacterium]|nr:hypothetical protein [Pyrinomonadaceae bacterium]